MAAIVFYEKPGCVNGEKQKKILKDAGHTLHCINILTYSWSRQKLLSFVAEKTVMEMMNPTAPAVKSGKIIPTDLTFDDAVHLMVHDPILIKRPLIEVEGMNIQGFMDPRLAIYLGNWKGDEDVVTCPNLKTLSCDEQKGANR